MKSTAEDDELIELYRGGHWKRFLAGAVLKRKTMIICGTNASGKTHISKACLDAVPRDERLITIEVPGAARARLTASEQRQPLLRQGQQGRRAPSMFDRRSFAASR